MLYNARTCHFMVQGGAFGFEQTAVVRAMIQLRPVYAFSPRSVRNIEGMQCRSRHEINALAGLGSGYGALPPSALLGRDAHALTRGMLIQSA
eukprot:5606387-Pleurochrysis_carterae.AAC.2